MTVSMKQFLPDGFKARAKDAAKKILDLHSDLKGKTEIEAKFEYVKLARSLPTFGVHFFVVRVSKLTSTSRFTVFMRMSHK